MGDGWIGKEGERSTQAADSQRHVNPPQAVHT